MRSKRTLLGAVLLPLALLAAACGGDDDGGQTASTEPAASENGDEQATETGSTEPAASENGDEQATETASTEPTASENGDEQVSEGASDEVAGTIKIAAQSPATGPAAGIGEVWKKGIEFGVAQVNANGGVVIDGERYEFELSYQDNETNPERAVGIAQEILRDGTMFTFGPSVTTLFQPTWESLKGNDIMVFTATTLAQSLLGTPEAEYLISTKVPDAGPDGAITANAAAIVGEWQPETVAILEPADPAGEVHIDAYVAALEEAGVEVVYQDTFEGTTQDFAPFITSMQQADPDVVIIGYLDRWATPFLDQAAAAGFTEPHFALAPGVSLASVQDRGDISASLIIPTRAVDNAEDETLADFREAYAEEFGSDPGPADFWMLTYYDSVRMLARAMEIANSATDLGAIADALATDEAAEYPGRALDLRIDENGAATYPHQNAFVENGEITYVDAG
ncbi:MAG: ABC transporter substrate-binding protein [Acidimicrobiia bacterium]